MKITIPELCLVALIGPTGSGESYFASRHFKPTEVVSSNSCRAMVADDANDQAATLDAFALLNFITSTRLRAGRLTVIDAASVQPQARASLVGLAKEHDCLPVAIVLNLRPRVDNWGPGRYATDVQPRAQRCVVKYASPWESREVRPRRPRRPPDPGMG